MKCPGCGTKYSGKKCPNCGRHTDPGAESKKITRIAFIAIVLVIVAVILYYLFVVKSYYDGLQGIVDRIIG